MIHAAKPEKRVMVSSVLLSAAFTSFLTGITEPIEFAFMFLAPALYLIHALLTGLLMALTYSIGMKLGFGFSAGLIDYLINWHLALTLYGLFLLVSLLLLCTISSFVFRSVYFT